MSLGLRPRRHAGVYAFVCVPDGTALDGLDVVAWLREREGTTLVLPEEQAVARGFEVLWRGCRITLELDTALDAVGLTARFAARLSEHGIACNVFAGAHHDHVFVPVEAGPKAERLLRNL
ncbi:MAG: ACT domain-containing protein [Planctomycetes bacterium]|nr:ACT domain-containing protein [Planctomycetota bacterium]